MKEKRITEEEIAQIPEECKISEVFREAINSLSTGAIIGSSSTHVVCLRDPELPSQKEKGYCPDPNCPMAIFPSRTRIKIVDSPSQMDKIPVHPPLG